MDYPNRDKVKKMVIIPSFDPFFNILKIVRFQAKENSLSRLIMHKTKILNDFENCKKCLKLKKLVSKNFVRWIGAF